jgi:hypothetical protein
MDDKQIDHAIDRAVREMMQVDPRPGMRARVIARVSRPEPRTNPWMRITAAGSLVAALLFVTIMLGRPEPAPGPTPTTIAEAPRSAPQQPVATPLTQPERAPVRRVPRQAAPPLAESRLVQAASFEAAEPFEPSVTIDPIAPIEAIQVTELTTKAIDSTEITIPPIPVATIDVAPLPPPK